MNTLNLWGRNVHASHHWWYENGRLRCAQCGTTLYEGNSEKPCKMFKPVPEKD